MISVYKITSRIFIQDGLTGSHTIFMKKYWINLIRKPPLKDWMKINVDTSKRHSQGLPPVGYVMMRDNQATIITERKQTGDLSCFSGRMFATHEIIVIAIQKIFRG